MSERGNQRANRDRPNRGQDENTHTFVNDAGETREATMREFRETLRDEGYRKVDEPEAETETPEAPV
jgi:hypothetical protein